MPSGVTAPLYNGETMSFPEFASRTARVVSPWNAYERDAPIDAPLSDGFEPRGSFDEKNFREDATELARVVSWTLEEADQQAFQHNLQELKSYLQSVRTSRERVKAYDFMSAQVAAWQAPTEQHEVMRLVMQKQLDETFSFERERVSEPAPAKITGEALRERTIRYLAHSVLITEGRIDQSQALLEQSSAFASEFKVSLAGWENVPVPRRVLP